MGKHWNGGRILDERENLDREGLNSLATAAMGFARAEIDRIAVGVVSQLQKQPAVGVFEDVAARHLWDEYCWALQEGPFDDEIGWEEVRLGSHSSAFDDTARAWIQCEVEKLPDHALVLLSVRAMEEGQAGFTERHGLGSIRIDGIVSAILDQVNAKASSRRLELIGPHRGDAIGLELEGSGMVWSILSDRGEAMDLVCGYVDELIDPVGDLSKLASEMVDAFVLAAREEGDSWGGALPEFLERFEAQVRVLVYENDVLPSLEAMRASLLEQWDG